MLRAGAQACPRMEGFAEDCKNYISPRQSRGKSRDPGGIAPIRRRNELAQKMNKPGYTFGNFGVDGRMPSWTVLFAIVTLTAGLLGFTGVAGAASGFAKLVFLVFLVMIVVSLAATALRTSRRRL